MKNNLEKTAEALNNLVEKIEENKQYLGFYKIYQIYKNQKIKEGVNSNFFYNYDKRIRSLIIKR